jgi:hypothetical protein
MKQLSLDPACWGNFVVEKVVTRDMGAEGVDMGAEGVEDGWWK